MLWTHSKPQVFRQAMSTPPLESDAFPTGLAGDYAWGLAAFYPEQGYWSEADYHDLTDGSIRRVEFVSGRLEFLPMPTDAHQ
jgi:hypothetical protein